MDGKSSSSGRRRFNSIISVPGQVPSIEEDQNRHLDQWQQQHWQKVESFLEFQMKVQISQVGITELSVQEGEWEAQRRENAKQGRDRNNFSQSDAKESTQHH